MAGSSVNRNRMEVEFVIVIISVAHNAKRCRIELIGGSGFPLGKHSNRISTAIS